MESQHVTENRGLWVGSLGLAAQLPTQLLQLSDEPLQSSDAVLQLSVDLTCGHICVRLLEEIKTLDMREELCNNVSNKFSSVLTHLGFSGQTPEAEADGGQHLESF